MATDLREYYKILGLSPGASQSQIKKAHRELALKYHPDKIAQSGLTKEEAEKKFKEIQEAFEILTGVRTPEGGTIPDESQSEP
jgi:DnaJ-class molecular chaperone